MVAETAFSKFLISFGQKVLSFAIKLRKESAKTKAKEIEDILLKNESIKAFDTRIAQRISKSLQLLQVPESVVAAFRTLDEDDVTRNRIAQTFLDGNLTPSWIIALLLSREQNLSDQIRSIDQLAAIWVDAIFASVSEVPALALALQLKTQYRIQSKLEESDLKLDALKEAFKSRERITLDSAWLRSWHSNYRAPIARANENTYHRRKRC